MNQRVKRSSRKGQNTDLISIGNSAHPARQSVDHSPAEVVIPPMKATGDIPEKKTLKDRLVGLAKASPLFKEVDPKNVVSKDDEKRVIAESIVDAQPHTKKDEDEEVD